MGLIEGAGPQDLASDLLIARTSSKEMKVSLMLVFGKGDV